MIKIGSRTNRRLLALGAIVAAAQLAGCASDGFLDPTKIGSWSGTAATVPILDRIDAIETEQVGWGQTAGPTAEDLIPSDLTYRISPGDVVTVRVFELFEVQMWSISTRRVDAAGTFRIPQLGDVDAAGYTAQEFEDALTERIDREIMPHPQVDVVVEEGSGFNYTMYGRIAGTGVYTLRDPDLRLLDALAIAGGVPPGTKKVYVIRSVPLSDEVVPPWERGGRVAPPPDEPDEPIDIEELIDRVPNTGGEADDPPSPGVLAQDPMVDIDDLQPIRVTQDPAIDIDRLRPPPSQTPPAGDDATFIYVEERGEWVRVAGSGADEAGAGAGDEPPLSVVERIIEIDYDRLSKGGADQNIVVRPQDQIYVEGPEEGLVYVAGEIRRPGVFQLPASGDLTLKRLIAVAGGLGVLAVPEKVDLTRMVGPNRQATIRLDLAAMYRGTEPDILIKPDDLINIGTTFWAAPLAVIRNGFRATYGFGFLLDRNFGNDVFGAPPVNRQ